MRIVQVCIHGENQEEVSQTVLLLAKGVTYQERLPNILALADIDGLPVHESSLALCSCHRHSAGLATDCTRACVYTLHACSERSRDSPWVLVAEISTEMYATCLPALSTTL